MAVLGVPIVIDGSHGEGGGALIRTALAMATLTQQALRVTNVRSGTKRSGLTSEDIAVIRALSASCGAETMGADINETSFSFLPTRRPRGLNEKLDVPDGYDGPGHANALVVLNSVLPVICRTGVYSTVSVRGETYGPNVLTYDYFSNVTLGAARRFGLYAYADLGLAGFGRGSRGDVTLEIEPSAITGVQWKDRGELIGVKALVVTSELPDQVGERGVAHLSRLGHYGNFKIEAEAIPVRSKQAGAFATVWAEFERGFGGATAIGARGVRIESVVQNAYESFADWLKTDATVDAHLADQLLLIGAMAEGETFFKVPILTQRFLTMAWVVKQFLPIHITIKGQEGGAGTVTIRRA